jgi:hypothetical protein
VLNGEKMRKDSKIWPLLLALFFLIPCSESLEPISLSNGIKEDVFNLDIGASQPGYKPFVSHAGFVSPAVPQIMALSPSAMLYQAKALRDETETIRNEAVDILQEIKAAASNVKKDAESVKSLAKTVRLDAEFCAEKADLAEANLQETRSIYNRTSALVPIISAAAEKNEALANRTAKYAAEVEYNLNESKILLAQIAFTAEELESLSARYQIEEGRLNNFPNKIGRSAINYPKR